MCIDLSTNMHVHACMYATKISGKKAMHLKESMEGCMEGFRERKWKGKMM